MTEILVVILVIIIISILIRVFFKSRKEINPTMKIRPNSYQEERDLLLLKEEEISKEIFGALTVVGKNNQSGNIKVEKFKNRINGYLIVVQYFYPRNSSLRGSNSSAQIVLSVKIDLIRDIVSVSYGSTPSTMDNSVIYYDSSESSLQQMIDTVVDKVRRFVPRK